MPNGHASFSGMALMAPLRRSTHAWLVMVFVLCYGGFDCVQDFEMNLMKEVKWDRDGIRKGHKKCKRREAASTAHRLLPLSGTFKDPLAPLRGKNAVEGQNRRNALTAER
ncbi:hypothetical protein LR48_Vigan11g068400 [Vigna angularis]|uniref:Uncharacterized protein n=1 Tax=Phaseolus angularis TaxID=3914 RepID=A0A0L9VRF0_PHAAN|nr:hypothetical protein LR48_Vigan11g068400 [Vigna angularis]